MKCLICNEEKETRNINLFTIGSEGTECCNDCSLLLTEIARNLMRYFQKKEMAKFKNVELGGVK